MDPERYNDSMKTWVSTLGLTFGVLGFSLVWSDATAQAQLPTVEVYKNPS